MARWLLLESLLTLRTETTLRSLPPCRRTRPICRVALQRLPFMTNGLRTCEADLNGLMVGQTLSLATPWSNIAAVLRRAKAAVGVGLARLLVGIQIVRMEATEFPPAEATCLRTVFTLAVSAGRQLMVDGTCFSRVDILELVRANWKTPLTKKRTLPALFLVVRL